MEKKKRNGFTIVEAVVSMAILTVITISSATVSLQALKQNRRNGMAVEASSVLQDFIEIYKVSESDSAFLETAGSYLGLAESPSSGESFAYGSVEYAISLEDGGIVLSALDSDGKTIMEVSYGTED